MRPARASGRAWRQGSIPSPSPPGRDSRAAAWRATVELDPHDPLGLRIEALVASLDDDDDPERGAEELGGIAVDRWTEAALALDDRPLLPRSLRSLNAPIGSVSAPCSQPDPAAERVGQAMAWAEEGAGLPDGNPFAGPADARAVREEIEALTAGREPAALDTAALAALGDRAVAMARERHEAAGFGVPPEKEPRARKRRGTGIEAEVALRLESAFVSERERALRASVLGHGAEGLDADEILAGLARARAGSPAPMTAWAPLAADEALRFGEALRKAIGAGSLPPHADVSHAGVEGLRFEGGSCIELLAERTAWRDAVLEGVRFSGGTLAGSTWSGVVLSGCRFDGVNLGQARFEGCVFDSCEIAGVPAADLTIVDTEFRDCRFERLDWTDPALRERDLRARDLERGRDRGGASRGDDDRGDRARPGDVPLDVRAGDELPAVRRSTRSGRWGRVFRAVASRRCRRGPAASSARCTSTSAQLRASTFEDTGFSGAVFERARIDDRTRFERCDFTGAAFAATHIAGATLVDCGLCASTWDEVDARRVRMRGAVLRGVDLRGVELAGAAIIESDLEGARFEPERTEGADIE